MSDDRRVMSCGNTRGCAGSIKQNVEGFTRRVDFEPGYDCLAHHGDAAGRRCHGRHGMALRFLLSTEEGAVQFLMYASDWLPGSIDFGSTRRDLPKVGVMAADLGHHWTSPVYEGQDGGGSCEYLHGADCWYDGSGLNAERVLVRFFDEGLDAIWEELEAYYRSCSDDAKKVRSGGAA